MSVVGKAVAKQEDPRENPGDTMPAYAQRYLDELLRVATMDTPTDAPKVIGEISAKTAKQPHIAVFVELGPGRFLGTTAGLSARPMPLPVAEGFQYFELCALTQADSPGVLWLLSNVGNYMLAAASPFFYGDPSITASEGGEAPKAKPFIAYQTLMFGGDGERVLFVPRWRSAFPRALRSRSFNGRALSARTPELRAVLPVVAWLLARPLMIGRATAEQDLLVGGGLVCEYGTASTQPATWTPFARAGSGRQSPGKYCHKPPCASVTPTFQ